MDESVDPSQAEPGTLTLLKNGVFVRGGELQKRHGMTALSSLSTRGSTVKVRRLFARGDALCAVATVGGDAVERVVTYAEVEGRWVEGDVSPEFSAVWSSPVDTHESVANPDVGYVAGFIVMLWRTGGSLPFEAGSLYYSVTEVASGTVMLPPTLLSTTAHYQRVVVSGTRVIMAWKDSVTGFAMGSFFDAASPFTASVPAAVTGALVGASPLDVAVMGDGSLGWAYSQGGDVQIMQTTSALGLLGGPFNLGAPGVTSEIGCSSFAARYLHIAYYDAGGTDRYAAFDFGTGATTGDAAIAARLVGIGNGTLNQAPLTCLAISATQGIVICGRRASHRNITTGLQIGNSVTVDGPVVGRPFLATSGRYYCVVAVQRNTVVEALPVASPTLVELPLPNATGADLPCFAAGSPAPRSWGDASNVAHVATDGTSYWFVASTSITPFSLTVTRQKQGLLLTKLTPAAGRVVTILGGLAVAASAAPWWYDGTRVGDVGFTTHAPVLAVAAGGTLTVGQAYLVGLVYERFDALGNLHRSGLTYASVTPTVGNQSVNVDEWRLSATSKQRSSAALAEPAYAMVSITQAAGSLFYRQTIPGTLLTANDCTAGGFATVNVTAANSGGQYALEYVTGGVLGDNPPPGFLDVCVHRDRLFGIAGDRRSIWFSKRMGDAPKTFPGFNEALVVRSEVDVVALASHEGVLLVLAKSGLYLLDGDGPPATGYPSDFGSLRRIPSSVGCLSAASVVSTSEGTFFQGTDGRLYRLQGSTLGSIGRPVDDDMAAYPTVAAAVLCETAAQVRFVCRNAADTAGVVLVYDLAFNQWSRFEYHHTNVQHGCWWRGKFVAAINFDAFYEDASTYYDNTSSWVYFELVTAWMSFAGATGWQRIRRVETAGEYRGPHKFYLELAVDYATSWQQSCLFDEAATVVNRNRATVHLGSQGGMSPRSRALRLRLRDDPRAYVAGQTGEGARWSGFGLDVLQQEGVSRHGAAKAKV